MALSGKIFFGQPEHSAGQKKYANEVWNHHHTVEGIGDAPEQAQVNGGPEDGDQRVNDQERCGKNVQTAEKGEDLGKNETGNPR